MKAVQRHRGESGFALLFVFALAAMVAIMLYAELPRVSFEAQRMKEQLLIDRGEQYKRAIELYVNKFGGKYPASIDQLENTNNIRFLRKRYKDPMTGKDEWRLIHIGPGGVYTDSLTMKQGLSTKKADGTTDSTSSSSSSSSFGSGASPGSMFGSSTTGSSTTGSSGTGSDGTPVVSAKPRLRQSDMVGAPGGTSGDMSGAPTTYDPQNPNTQDPNTQDPNTQDPNTVPAPAPGQIPGSTLGPDGQPIPADPTQIGQPQITQPGQYPGQPGSQGPPPFRLQPGMTGGQMPGQYPGQIQMPGAGQGSPTLQPGAAPVPDLIRNMLTTPRQQGPGLGNSSMTIGGGIAGVASKYEAEGIKSYNDHTKYNEWEFIYDPRTDAKKRGIMPLQNVNPLGNQQQPQQQQNQQKPGN